jgi:hypothetical protein
MPTRTSSTGQPVTWPIIRTPSSSSIIATTYGSSFENGGAPYWRTTVKV